MKKAIFFCILFLINPYVQASNPLRIVGSSAVYPFAATVAEHFGYKTHELIPIIEAIGTGGGLDLFCKKKGPDGAMASRRMTRLEKEKCQKAGVTFEEFIIGQDGLVFIRNKQEKPFFLTLQLLRKALVENISVHNKCVKNPNITWNQAQQDLPPYSIRVLGPAPTSGTYDVLIDKLENPCGPYLRPDGGYIEAPANENLVVQKILAAPHTLGLVTFSFYAQNEANLYAFPVNGILPSIASIQEGSYALSRPLYIYLKTNNLKQNRSRISYILEFTSNEAIGAKGYLSQKGLVPLPLGEQKRMQIKAQNLWQEAGGEE